MPGPPIRPFPARIEWRHVDLLARPPQQDSFELVSSQFMQLPPGPRARLFTALAAAVRAGGALLVVGHHPSDMDSGVHRPPQPDRFYTADDIAGLLDVSWTIVAQEARPRTSRLGQRGGGHHQRRGVTRGPTVSGSPGD